MKILEILNKPWMISREDLEQIAAIYKTHLQGEKIDFKALQPNPRDRGARAFEVIEGHAIIDVAGPLTPGASFFSFYFGGTSYKEIESQIRAALEATDVERIILNIDSPGGSVQGAFELAEFIEKARETKSIISFSDGTIASAAYAIASATDEILITGKTNQVGSVGVIARRYDDTKANELHGYEVEEFVSGRYKNISSPDKPLDDFDREAIQGQVDYLFSIFANEVSRLRAIEIETIQKWEARIFIGEQSIEAGLVDGVSTLAELTQTPFGTGAAAKQTIQKVKMEPKELTLEALQKERPDLVDALHKASYAKGHEAGIADGRLVGGDEERQRIEAITKIAFPGQEALLEQLIADSAVTVGEAAIRFNEAERATREAAGAVIETEAAKPVETDEPGVEVTPKVDESDPKAVWDADQDLQDEFGGEFERFEAFLKADAQGLVKILNK
jgi:capsid assembly protease